MHKILIKNILSGMDDLVAISKSSATFVTKPAIKSSKSATFPVKEGFSLDLLDIVKTTRPSERTLPDGKIERFIYRSDGTLRKSIVEDWDTYPLKITRFDKSGNFLCQEIDEAYISIQEAFKFDERTLRSIEKISKSKNVSMYTAGVIARSSRLKCISEKQADEIIKSIREKCSSKSIKSSRFFDYYKYSVEEFDTCIIAKFIDENPQIKLVDFKKYIDSISLEELYKMAPRLSNFNCDEMLEFLKHHFLRGTTKFHDELLKFPGDFTKYIEENPVDAYQMKKLLAMYPNTNRNVGSLPKGWNIKMQKQEDEIRKIFDKFRKIVARTNDKTYNPYSEYTDFSEVIKELSIVIGKDVEISFLGCGKFSSAYKISVSGADDTVIKIFHKKPRTFYDSFNEHGQFVETQRGLFLAANSDNFAKTYFGKIATEIDRDGYVLTEFLEDTGKKAVTKEYIELENYLVFGDDIAEGHNIIDGKIFDFGDMHIVPRK